METLIGWCGTLPAGGSLGVALFLMGLAGSAVHCGPMCGGFVLGQVADRMACLRLGGEWRRIGAGALVPYHLGRLTTYAGLGAIMGGGAGAWLPSWAAPAFLLFGLIVLLGRIVPRFGLGLLHRTPAGWSQTVSRLASLASGNGYLLGVALGFLPCGLLLGALSVAAATGTAMAGALGMAALWAGTVPALVAVGIGGNLAGWRWRHRIAAWAPAVATANAALLAIVAIGRF